jgi:hypothetical protein
MIFTNISNRFLSLSLRQLAISVILLLKTFTILPAMEAIDSTTVPEAKFWTLDGSYIFNFTQSSFTNWVPGGENQIGFSTILKPKLVFDNGKWSWVFSMDMRYGLQKNAETKARKSDDVLQAESKFGRQIGKKWKFSGLYTYSTQFSPSYDLSQGKRLLSTILAPAYANLSLGFDYNPVKTLSIYMTPLSLRTTYVLNDSLANVGEFGVTPGDKVLRRVGPAVLLTYKDEVLKNIIMDTRLGVFQDTFRGNHAPVVNWDMILTLKVNKLISTTLTCSLFFDEDSKIEEKDDDGNISGKVAKIQFKQTLGVGFSITW